MKPEPEKAMPMSTVYPSAAPSAAYGGRPNILRRMEAWLDAKGRFAWISAMVVSFVFFWPLGLFFVFYITYTQRWSSEKMFGCAARRHRGHDRHAFNRAAPTSGNSAFDSYKFEMLKRLEDEQSAFESFLQRLRAAKDKSEFDAFMEDRAKEGRAKEGRANEGRANDAPETAAKADQAARTGEY